MTVLPAAVPSLVRLLGDVPVDPDAETARRMAEAELANSIYHERPDLLARALEWVVEQISEAGSGITALDPRLAAAVVAGLLVIGGGIALLVAGPLRRARSGGRTSIDVFGDDTRTAAELRASADALADLGQWAGAVLDRFRAILRSLEERALLDERPGRTAHEAAEEAGLRLPGCAADLRRAGVLFDDVCYGHAEPGAPDDLWLRSVDEHVGSTRPVRNDEVAGPSEASELARVPR